MLPLKLKSPKKGNSIMMRQEGFKPDLPDPVNVYELQHPMVNPGNGLWQGTAREGPRPEGGPPLQSVESQLETTENLGEERAAQNTGATQRPPQRGSEDRGAFRLALWRANTRGSNRFRSLSNPFREMPHRCSSLWTLAQTGSEKCNLDVQICGHSSQQGLTHHCKPSHR